MEGVSSPVVMSLQVAPRQQPRNEAAREIPGLRTALYAHPTTVPGLFPTAWHQGSLLEARLTPKQSLCKLQLILALETRILQLCYLLACLFFTLGTHTLINFYSGST